MDQALKWHVSLPLLPIKKNQLEVSNLPWLGTWFRQSFLRLYENNFYPTDRRLLDPMHPSDPPWCARGSRSLNIEEIQEVQQLINTGHCMGSHYGQKQSVRLTQNQEGIFPLHGEHARTSWDAEVFLSRAKPKRLGYNCCPSVSWLFLMRYFYVIYGN